MPRTHALVGVLPLRLLCHQAIITRKNMEDDFAFIKTSLTKSDISDYGGYNTENARNNGKIMAPKTKILYRPLINKTPSDPSTVLTAMIDVESISKDAGQNVSVFTCDQQIYRVALNVIWANPTRWSNFYPRIGGMHWLMIFVGCADKLMANSGLEKLVGSAFGGVSKMLIGKIFPMNIRALRLVVLELLHGLVDEIADYDDLIFFLDSLAIKSHLAKHWVNNLIKPVLIMMLYLRAEQQAEFALHLYACRQMFPYFFGASHWNYSRDGVAHMQRMEKLPNSVLEPFLKD